MLGPAAVDTLAVQVRIMKNELERKSRDMAQKRQDFNARIRELEGHADAHGSNATPSTEVIEI